MSKTNNQPKWYDVPEDCNLQKQCCENFKSCNIQLFFKLYAYTCRIFISTTPSLDWSVPTNLAWVTASAMFSTVAGMDCRVGSRQKITWQLLVCVCVCVCVWEREKERERRQPERETKIAAATSCFLRFVNIILATVVYQKRKNKLSLI
jgi:hypothetical protein